MEPPGDPRAAAVDVLRRVLRPDARLPGMVFAEEWGTYLFFDEGRVFSPGFVPVAKSMLEGGGGRVVAIAELREWESGVPESECLWFFDRETTLEKWRTKLAEKGSGPWFATKGDFCLAPDSGAWCIYTEKAADLAILAIRDRPARDGLAAPIRELDAHPFEEAAERKTLFCFHPAMLPKWLRGLRENYGENRKKA